MMQSMHATRPVATVPADVTPAFTKTDPIRILVVDDDLFLCAFNAELLGTAGFEVDIAEDGAAGWEALCAKHYDLVITDNNMPKVSGMELLKRVRAESADLPVILVSGAMPTEELARHPNLRLTAALSKPYTGANLLGIVQKVLSNSKRTRSKMQDTHTTLGEPAVEIAAA